MTLRKLTRDATLRSAPATGAPATSASVDHASRTLPAPAGGGRRVRHGRSGSRGASKSNGGQTFPAADDGRGGGPRAPWADVDRAVSGRPGRGPRNGRVWNGDGRARSRRWFNAGVPDDEIPGLQRGLRRGRSERASSPATGLTTWIWQDLLVDDLSTRRRFGACCEAGSCSALPAVRRCTVRFTNGFEGSPLAGR